MNDRHKLENLCKEDISIGDIKDLFKENDDGTYSLKRNMAASEYELLMKMLDDLSKYILKDGLITSFGL